MSVATITTPEPYVGGISGGHPWTGGSNVTASGRDRPLSTMAFRPLDCKHAFTVEQAAVKGLPETRHLCKDDKTSKVTLTLWIDAVGGYME